MTRTDGRGIEPISASAILDSCGSRVTGLISFPVSVTSSVGMMMITYLLVTILKVQNQRRYLYEALCPSKNQLEPRSFPSEFEDGTAKSPAVS